MVVYLFKEHTEKERIADLAFVEQGTADIFGVVKYEPNL